MGLRVPVPSTVSVSGQHLAPSLTSRAPARAESLLLRASVSHSHNEAPLPRAFLLPRKVAQINEITLRRSHPRPRAGSAGCGRMCGGGLGIRCHLPGLHPCPGCCSGSGEAPAADRATPAGPARMRSCSGLCRQGVRATAMGRSSPSLPSRGIRARRAVSWGSSHSSLPVASAVQRGPGTCPKASPQLPTPRQPLPHPLLPPPRPSPAPRLQAPGCSRGWDTQV